jgi:hypothetical protein
LWLTLAWGIAGLLLVLLLIVRQVSRDPDVILPESARFILNSADWALFLFVVGLILSTLPNFLHAWVVAHFNSRIGSSKTFFSNHDLSKAVGQSLRLILLDAADSQDGDHLPRVSSENARNWLREHADSVPDRWGDFVATEACNPNSPYKALFEKTLWRFVEKRDAPVLAQGLWEKVLTYLNGGTTLPFASDDAAMDAIEERLNSRFGEALWEYTKNDFVNGGAESEAMNLLIASQLLQRTTAMAEDIGSLSAAVKDLADEWKKHKDVVEGTVRKLEKGQTWALRLLQANTKALDRIEHQIRELADATREGDAKTHRLLEDHAVQIESKLDEITSTQKQVIQLSDRTEAARTQVDLLRKEASSLAIELRYDEAYECMARASEIANTAKIKSLEFECRMIQMSHAAVQAERGDRSIAIERLRRIHYALKNLDTSTWHHLAVELWISRIQNRKSEIIRIGKELLNSTELPLVEKADVLSALALAFGNTGEKKELLNIREPIKEVADSLRDEDPDYAMTLWSNYISSASRLSVIEQKDVDEFIHHTRAACSMHGVSLLRIAEVISATGDDVFKHARSAQSLDFARAILLVGYELVELNGNAMKSMEFALQIAQMDAEHCHKEAALGWLAKADEAKSRPCKHDSPDARIAHLFGLERAKGHIFLILARCVQGEEKLELLRLALKSAQQAEGLYGKCLGAISGNVNLERDIAELKERVVKLLSSDFDLQ